MGCKIEKWSKFEALYWSFITATTVGYGDFKPTQGLSRVLAVLIAFLGIIYAGFIVAITVNSATVVIQKSEEFRSLISRQSES